MTDTGINLTAVSYWANEEAFIDRFKTAGPWLARDANYNDITHYSVDANGFPTDGSGIANLWTMINVDPLSSSHTNQYVMTYSGSAANIVINGAEIVSRSDGQIVFNVTTNDARVQLDFLEITQGDTIHDVHVVRADQVSLYNSGEIFNPDFVSKISNFDTIRFMDWGNTNTSTLSSWDDRTQLNHGSYGSDQASGGVPLEAMVKLCNEAHTNMWLNIPTDADDNYVRQALTYIKNNLGSGLQVHIEWSNEVWNTSFSAHQYAQNEANQLWGNGGQVDQGASIYYGYRSAQIAKIAHDVFGDQAASRVVDVLAGQAANPALLAENLRGVALANVGSVTDLFKEYAVAPYFGDGIGGAALNTADHDKVMSWVNGGADGLTAAFNELAHGGSLSSDTSVDTLNQWLIASATAAHAAGLQLAAYEGGQSMDSFRYTGSEQAQVTAFEEQLLNDPRMGQLYATLLADFKAAGGTDYMAFADVSSTSVWGHWGMLDDIYQSGSERYDALMDFIQSNSSTIVPRSIISATPMGGALSGTSGNDVLSAGSGNDTVSGMDGDDSINGSSGSTDSQGHLVEADSYYGGAGSDTIQGGAGNDHIYGNSITAVVGAVDGGDQLNGGGGNDYIQGNAGNDTIDGGDGNDRLYGGADNDSVTGSAGNDYLQGNRGDDTLAGGADNDTVHGGAGNDVVTGDAGNDLLYGDAGNDTITGGTGTDLMSGGAGNDTFVFHAHDAALTTSGDAYRFDEITDFASGSDKLSFGFQVTAVLQGSAGSVSAAASIAAEQLAAHAGAHDVAAVTVGADTYLFYDSTGAGGTLDSAIKMDGLRATALSVSDFV